MRTVRKIFYLGVIIFGTALSDYAISLITKYGFYISTRGELGQLEGGVAPLLLVIGTLSIIYGFVELKYLSTDSESDD